MSKPGVITDYYGTEVEVDAVCKSAGPFVYVDRHPSEPFLEVGCESTMDRFTPDEARRLAAQLNDAADEAEKHCPPPQDNNNGAVAAPERSSK